jgi:hypothetical protein
MHAGMCTRWTYRNRFASCLDRVVPHSLRCTSLWFNPLGISLCHDSCHVLQGVPIPAAQESTPTSNPSPPAMQAGVSQGGRPPKGHAAIVAVSTGTKCTEAATRASQPPLSSAAPPAVTASPTAASTASPMTSTQQSLTPALANGIMHRPEILAQRPAAPPVQNAALTEPSRRDNARTDGDSCGYKPAVEKDAPAHKPDQVRSVFAASVWEEHLSGSWLDRFCGARLSSCSQHSKLPSTRSCEPRALGCCGAATSSDGESARVQHGDPSLCRHQVAAFKANGSLQVRGEVWKGSLLSRTTLLGLQHPLKSNPCGC